MPKKSYPPLTIEWTHIADAMPSPEHAWPRVLLVIERGIIRAAHFAGGRFVDVADYTLKPTHWAEIPRDA